jgi:pimeloyl-ACP methyl ester carboxylesterase
MYTGPVSAAINDRLTLNVRTWGPDEPEVVLIHGFGDGAFIWTPLVRLLKPTVSVAAIDLRGHGESQWDQHGRYDVSTYAGDVGLVLESLDLSNVILVGHSLGAEVALRVARSHSARVRALALIDAVPHLRKEIFQDVVTSVAERRRYSSVSAYVDVLHARVPLATWATIDEIAGHALRALGPDELELKCDPRIATRFFAPRLEDAWSAANEIRIPALLVRGAHSAALSAADARALHRRFADCTFAEVPKAGHAIMLDNPRGLNAAVQPFLDRVGAMPS